MHVTCTAVGAAASPGRGGRRAGDHPMDSIRADGNARTGHDDPAAAVARALIHHDLCFIITVPDP